jgi:hypothetical protein
MADPYSAAGNSTKGRGPGFFRLLWRAARQIFHETTGTLFLLLALSWTVAAFRLWRHGAGPWLLGACVSFALLLALFGLTSFKSAQRVR